MRMLYLLAGTVLVGSLATASVILLTPHKPLLLASEPALADVSKPGPTPPACLPTVVRAQGTGLADLKSESVEFARLKAERAAKLQALRGIFLKLQARRDLENLTKTEIASMLREFVVEDTKYFSDGSIDVELSIDLSSNRALAVAQTRTREDAEASVGLPN